MSPAHQFSFDRFRLDPGNARLWRSTQALPLTLVKPSRCCNICSKSAGELVTKEALFAAVWRDTVVSDGALKVCMAEIPRVLGDAARTPQFIKTEHRPGYRFIATVTDGPSAAASHQSPMSSAPSLKPLTWALPTSTVGRQAGVGQLHEWFEKALGGRRQVVFITGDAGIGKTTLVDLFLSSAWRRRQPVGGRAGNASTIMGPVKLICRCWKP